MSSITDVSSLISELKALKDNVAIDEAQRQELCAALQEASLAIESPLEAVDRVGFSVGHLLLLVSLTQCLVGTTSCSCPGGH